MNPEHKKYILEKMGSRSPAEIASGLGLKERVVKRFVEAEKARLAASSTAAEAAPPEKPKAPARRIPFDKFMAPASVVFIAILGLLIYVNSLNGKFVYDDEILVQNNAFIRGWSTIPKLFTSGFGTFGGVKSTFYRPFQMMTYAADYAVWNLNVVGYHLTNILLHLLTALCVYWLVTVLFGDKILSLLTAAFFVAHPIHTTVVDYISDRADSLYLSLMLISFICYIKSSKGRGAVYYAVMIAAYSLAMLSKENALILPALLLLYHYAFKEKIRWRGFAAVSAAAAVYLLLRITVLRQITTGETVGSAFLQRVPGFFAAAADYIRLLLLPFGLHMEYGTPLFKAYDPKVICGLALLIALVFCAVRARKTSAVAFFGLSWFLITLLPVSNLYPLYAYMAEHWLYLPSIGIFLVLAASLEALYKKERYRAPAIIFTACLLAFYSILTIAQNRTWADPISFYERTLKYAPDSSKTYNNLGLAYYRAGRREEAAAMYERAVEANPNNAAARDNLAAAYNGIAARYYGMGRRDEAIAMYKKAIELDPRNADLCNDLANSYYGSGRREEAAIFYKKAIELRPDFAAAYSNLANVYDDIGRRDEAIAMYKKAIELKPDYADAYNNLGAAYSGAGRREEAIAAFKKALEINPDQADARRNLDAIKTR